MSASPPASLTNPALAGMLALRRDATVVRHEDFVEGTQAVQMKKKSELSYVS